MKSTLYQSTKDILPYCCTGTLPFTVVKRKNLTQLLDCCLGVVRFKKKTVQKVVRTGHEKTGDKPNYELISYMYTVGQVVDKNYFNNYKRHLQPTKLIFIYCLIFWIEIGGFQKF